MNEYSFLNEVKELFKLEALDKSHSYQSYSGSKNPKVIRIDDLAVGCIGLEHYPGMQKGWVNLSYLYIYKPSLGTGSRIMAAICELADKYSISLFLSAAPQEQNGDTMSQGKLMSWYASYGFKCSNVSGSNIMEREQNA